MRPPKGDDTYCLSEDGTNIGVADLLVLAMDRRCCLPRRFLLAEFVPASPAPKIQESIVPSIEDKSRKAWRKCPLPSPHFSPLPTPKPPSLATSHIITPHQQKQKSPTPHFPPLHRSFLPGTYHHHPALPLLALRLPPPTAPHYTPLRKLRYCYRHSPFAIPSYAKESDGLERNCALCYGCSGEHVKD